MYIDYGGLLFWPTLYTPCPEKKSLQYSWNNFIKYWSIFEILLTLPQSLEICNKAIIKYSTTPQMRRCTTL